MPSSAQAGILADGRRLHLNHGPIDLIVEAWGADDEVRRAREQAAARFEEILPTLVGELSLLRSPVTAKRPRPDGPVARRMVDAVWPHRAVFVTPMAAVAGAVADEVLAAMTAGRRLERAYVNNGGDIAFHLAAGQSLRAGLVGDYHRPAIDGSAELDFDMPVRGIATSGWKGRSFSLGIADAVTVLAENAAAADVAATLIANAVDIDHPAVERRPACELDPDSDLGARLVTTAVGQLEAGSVAAALERGVAVAGAMERAGHIRAAVLVLQDEVRSVGRRTAGLIASRAA